MTDTNDTRQLIRKAFNYLTTTYSFVEDFNIQTHPIYSEVKFKRNDWTLSIITAAHGTKISLSLISPSEDFGYLSFYFNKLNKNYQDNDWATTNLTDNVKHNSEFLRQQGQEILKADSTRLTEILDFLKAEQRKSVEAMMKKQSDV